MRSHITAVIGVLFLCGGCAQTEYPSRVQLNYQPGSASTPKMAYVYGIPAAGSYYDSGKWPHVVWGNKVPGENAGYVYPEAGYLWANDNAMDLAVIPAKQ